MKRTLVVTTIADENIDEQLVFFVGKDPDLARRFLSALYDDTFPSLLQCPELGRSWKTDKHLLEDVRWRRVPNFPNHMVFYRPTKETVEILWVLYGSRNLPLILEEE